MQFYNKNFTTLSLQYLRGMKIRFLLEVCQVEQMCPKTPDYIV